MLRQQRAIRRPEQPRARVISRCGLSEALDWTAVIEEEDGSMDFEVGAERGYIPQALQPCRMLPGMSATGTEWLPANRPWLARVVRPE